MQLLNAVPRIRAQSRIRSLRKRAALPGGHPRWVATVDGITSTGMWSLRRQADDASPIEGMMVMVGA